MREGSTEEEMKQQQRMKAVMDVIRKFQAKGRMDSNRSCWLPTAKKRGSIRDGKILCRNGTIGNAR